MRRLSGVACLLGACLSPELLGCATMRESLQTQVLSSREERTPVRREPADRIEIQSKVDGAVARIAVRIEPVCTTTVVEHREVVTTRHKTPEGLFDAELVTFLVSAGVFGFSTAVAVTWPEKQRDYECDSGFACEDGGKIIATLVAGVSGIVAAVSGIMVGVDLLRTIPSTTKKTEVLPPRDQAAPCTGPVPARPRRVALLFADGTESTALLVEGESVVQIPIPEDLRARFPDGISARVAVDGRVVGRLHVE